MDFLLFCGCWMAGIVSFVVGVIVVKDTTIFLGNLFFGKQVKPEMPASYWRFSPPCAGCCEPVTRITCDTKAEGQLVEAAWFSGAPRFCEACLAVRSLDGIAKEEFFHNLEKEMAG